MQWLTIATNDMLIHTWDLARAIGADEALPAGEGGLSGFPRAATALDPARSGRYVDAVQVPDDPDAQTKLLAFAGRRVEETTCPDLLSKEQQAGGAWTGWASYQCDDRPVLRGLGCFLARLVAATARGSNREPVVTRSRGVGCGSERTHLLRLRVMSRRAARGLRQYLRAGHLRLRLPSP